LTVAGIGAIGAVLLILYLRWKGRPRMLQLTIVTPGNGTIAVAGTPVVFNARTDPAQLAAKISWTVTNHPEAHGAGPTFAHTFAATGVEQVVARLPVAGLVCDAIVYVFKTPSGGSTAADIAQAEPPPPGARGVEAFTAYGPQASAIGRAS
jgi:hypothetical protein